MIIISDTSPITNLIQLDKLDLLQRLFSDIIIPNEVYEELVVYENHRIIIESIDWITVISVSDTEKVELLKQDLDAGEAEAIVLAKELNCDFLLIDERKGREIAQSQNIKITGLLGILIQAKRRGFIPLLRPLLEKLVNQIGFRVNRNLFEHILREVNEE